MPVPLFAATIFLSAFLLFQVQPLIGKILLPWFGGTPAVWNTCMLFFQVLLLGGYAYAHFSIERWDPRKQAKIHVGLLAAACLLTFPSIMPLESLAPSGEEAPLPRILLLLSLAVGLPYFALSATGSLVQAWFARRYPERSPYPLYALSNTGSLLGLLTFPFVVEPNLRSGTQAGTWYWGFVVFAGLCIAVARAASGVSGESVKADSPGSDSPEEAPPAPPARGLFAIWVGFGACGSTMLLATTNQMAIDVASVPFLWVLPLALYLLSFILCFGSEARYPRVLFYPLLVAFIVAILAVMTTGPSTPLELQIGSYAGGLFVFVMVCHGELYRLRPHPRYLTSFYLALSLGGALGGIFVGLIAPFVFAQYYELHLGIFATCGLTLYAFWRDPRLELPPRVLQAIVGAVTLASVGLLHWARQEHETNVGYIYPAIIAAAVALLFAGLVSLRKDNNPETLRESFVFKHRLTWIVPFVAMSFLTWGLAREANYRIVDSVKMSRGFFGMLRVVDRYLDDEEHAQRVLYHGAIKHGFQYLRDDKQMWHNSYFAPYSGIGVALSHHPKRAKGEPLRIGLLGLGGGTLMTYGQKGDVLRIYEIDPEVEHYSREYFSYFDRTEAQTEVIIGDGRLRLERDEPQNYDILILDAFSSDAIPLHLLTQEAFEVYMRHLAPDGILAANLTNRHVDIKPVVKALSAEHELEFRWISNGYDRPIGVYAADWGLMTKDPVFLKSPEVTERMHALDEVRTGPEHLWTDDFTNLWSVLHF